MNILVADDREEDLLLLKAAFARAANNVSLDFVRDGQEAIKYLSSLDRTLPSILLLDLKMPRIDGFGVLRWLRSQENHLRRLPVVVFTSSDDLKDINLAYDLGANSYLVKPVELEELIEIARHLAGYWFNLNRCPSCAPASIAPPG